MGTITDIVGRSPYAGPDDTRSWVESLRAQRKAAGKGDLLKPSLLLRFATDSTYVRNQPMRLYEDHPRDRAETRALMNTALPGQRIPNILNWQVNEAVDQVTSTASFEALNCLPISQTSTTLTSTLDERHHNPRIKSTFIGNSKFVVDRIDGNTNPEYREDRYGYGYREERLRFRLFEHDIFTVTNSLDFPNPAIPDDADNDIPDDAEFVKSATGSGAYYVLINEEVIRVIQKEGNTFYIPAGGRAVNGIIQSHSPGAVVTLLGFGPYSGKWTALGYLNTDDFRPQKSLMRPGNCIVSYEGYDDITGLLSHNYDPNRHYQFTGYWFIAGTEPSLGEDGVPRIRVDLKGPGHMFETQKINPDMLQRMTTRFGQWRVGQREADAVGKTIWGAAEHNRNIPGDWVDFNSWEPSLPGSYPLKIKTMFAQHKEFFDHMRDTNFGKECEFCRTELTEWLKQNKDDPKNQLQKERQVGKHIYKQSIRVMDTEAGPIKTYIRLMSTIAAAAWDHPAYGTEASYRFTKIPNKLYNNIRNIHTGLIYDGQLSVDLNEDDAGFKWHIPTYDDTDVLASRKELSCPFESTYDRAPFSQPMTDLAEANGAMFCVRREGYPVFVPTMWALRPPQAFGQTSIGWRDLRQEDPFPTEHSEWFASYGASISGYSHSINSEAIVTQSWVTATTAFESSFTIASGGTGFDEQGIKRINYSPLGGNRGGLSLTGGVQQTDSLSLDNFKLGLDWNTRPAGWGVQEARQNGTTVVEGLPPLHDGVPNINRGDTGNAVKRVQRTINFFLERRYMSPYKVNDVWVYQLDVGGVCGAKTAEGIEQLERFLSHHTSSADKTTLGVLTVDKIYNHQTYKYVKNYLDKNKFYLQTDIWWYVHNGKTWEEYVAAITGVAVPMKPGNVEIKLSNSNENSITTPRWVPDDKGMALEIDKWQTKFAKVAINAGNKQVDDSIDKSTVRSLQSNIADPRILPADVIWAEVPGYLGARTGERLRAPFTNGIFVASLNRQMDLTTGTYTATYTGNRFRGDFGIGMKRNVSKGFEFVT